MRADRRGLAALRTPRGTFAVAVTLVVAGAAALLLWNTFHYDWLRGYDAYANSLYTDVIRDHQRLPTEAETDVWHTPPLFFVAAALIASHRGVQVFNALCVLVVIVLAGLIARELFPRSRLVQLGALVFAALTPVLVRTAIMYHPEPLATALATAGLYVVVRAISRGSVGPWTGVVTGALFGLGTLTRTWTLSIAAAACCALLYQSWSGRTRRPLAAAGTLAATLLVVTLPWFVHHQRTHGSPFAFNRPAPDESFFARRPAEFYTSLDVEAVFSRPYAPHYLNHLLPVVYTDWWGDYWRYFGIPAANISTPPELPPRYENPRVRQSYVGLTPSLLAAAGLVGLVIIGLRLRTGALLVLPFAVLLLALEFVVFQISYPHADGDTIKATYLLNAVAPVAVCSAWALAILRKAGRLVMIAVMMLLAYAAALDVAFLVLSA